MDIGFSKKTKKQNEISVSSVAPCENKKKYEAFGNLVWEEGIYDDNREFTSKEKDPTGFHYFGARYYWANLGRFGSPDPMTINPQLVDLNHPQTLNPYVYCHNDPLNFLDPWGLYEDDFDRPDKYYEGEGVTVTEPREWVTVTAPSSNNDVFVWWSYSQSFSSGLGADKTNYSRDNYLLSKSDINLKAGFHTAWDILGGALLGGVVDYIIPGLGLPAGLIVNLRGGMQNSDVWAVSGSTMLTIGGVLIIAGGSAGPIGLLAASPSIFVNLAGTAYCSKNLYNYYQDSYREQNRIKARGPLSEAEIEGRTLK